MDPLDLMIQVLGDVRAMTRSATTSPHYIAAREDLIAIMHPAVQAFATWLATHDHDALGALVDQGVTYYQEHRPFGPASTGS